MSLSAYQERRDCQYYWCFYSTRLKIWSQFSKQNWYKILFYVCCTTDPDSEPGVSFFGQRTYKIMQELLIVIEKRKYLYCLIQVLLPRGLSLRWCWSWSWTLLTAPTNSSSTTQKLPILQSFSEDLFQPLAAIS